MPDNAASIVVFPDARSLCVTPDQIARYAGGARYRMDASARELAAVTADRALDLITPAFVYRACRITGFEGENAVLQGGQRFPVPEGDGGTEYIGFCICTIGGRLEEEVRALLSGKQMLEGLFLDAAGVAALEALGTHAYGTMQKLARDKSLFAGCKFGPGYEELDIALQRNIFDLVDSSRIGVRLNDSCVMIPGKSLSFFVKWTVSRPPAKNRDKCASCSLARCAYRKAETRPGDASHAGPG